MKKGKLLIVIMTCMLISTLPVMSQTHPDLPHLSIYYPKEANDDTSYPTYVGSDPDAWINESWVNFQVFNSNAEYTFDVGVKNKANVKVEDIRLLIAIPNTTTSDDLGYISVSNGESAPLRFTSAILVEVIQIHLLLP
jgi:hypothetical protein